MRMHDKDFFSFFLLSLAEQEEKGAHYTPTTHAQTKILRELIFWLIHTTLKRQKIHVHTASLYTQ